MKLPHLHRDPQYPVLSSLPRNGPKELHGLHGTSVSLCSPIICRSMAREPRAGAVPPRSPALPPSQGHPCPGNTGRPHPQEQTLPHQSHPRTLSSPGSRFPPLQESGRPGPATPQCGGSWRRVPAGEEGSSQAAPSGPSKVSCLPQELCSACPRLSLPLPCTGSHMLLYKLFTYNGAFIGP